MNTKLFLSGMKRVGSLIFSMMIALSMSTSGAIAITDNSDNPIQHTQNQKKAYSVCATRKKTLKTEDSYKEWIKTYKKKAKKQKEKTLSSSQWKKIKKQFDDRKNKILNSKSTIKKGDTLIPGETYNGTAYYISNNGSDENDGLSPETPFATLHPFREIELKKGDALFFERGSVWRGEPLCEKDWQFKNVQGLTYSAYGEGQKPCFYGGVENGTGADKWKLFYQEGNKKIWVYYRDMTDVGGLHVNGGKAFARDLAWWSGSKYFKIKGKKNYSVSDTEYDVKKDLPDEYCFPMLEYPKTNYEKDCKPYVKFWYEQENDSFNEYVSGPLYFRYDKGNPGEVFSSIEFIQPYYSPIWNDGTVDDTTFDNLCFSGMDLLCTGRASENERANGVVIQNCESAFMGGIVDGYSKEKKNEYDFGVISRYGDGFVANGSNVTIKNNYIHDAFQSGTQIETFEGDPEVKNTIITGNVIEKCLHSLHMNDNNNSKLSGYTDCEFSNNMVFNACKNNRFWRKSDYGADGGQEMFFDFGFHSGFDPVKNVTIKNNIFGPVTEKNAPLIFLGGHYTKKYRRIFSGNTYIQKKGYMWILNESFPDSEMSKIPMNKVVAKWLLGDTKAKLWRIK